MTRTVVFPRLGELLRTLITRAGYRGHITSIGLDKDLDDLANEARPGSTSDLMQAIETACAKEIAVDCGAEWAQLFSLAWFRTREAIQQLVQNVDASPIANEQGRALVTRQFDVPMLSGVLRLSMSLHPGPDIELWWKCPFSAWIEYASRKVDIPIDKLLTNLANQLNADTRSVERWKAGEPMGKLSWPYRATVNGAFCKGAKKRIEVSTIDQVSGWLMIATAFQSLQADLRERVRRNYAVRPLQPWSVRDAIQSLTRQRDVPVAPPVFGRELPVLQAHISNLFQGLPGSSAQLKEALALLNRMIQEENLDWQPAIQFIHDFFSARLAAINGDENNALRLYEAAVSRVWWHSGENQHPVLNEALLYAVGVGRKVAAEHFWDKTFLLGLNTWPKRPLDEQELRRISFGFEKIFAPLKAKERIPPPVEIIVREEAFSLNPQQIANPNRKAKFAEGRVRRTPLMEAILEGTLEDVKQAIAAGGDPNDFIKESGEGPLTYAMRRACDHKDPIIMEHLLGFDLLPETVNRAASTKRETPLKIAIEMANAKAADRLIELGADVEAACDTVPSALCYALLLLHGSLHRDDRTQEQAYLAGKTRGDVYDAKDGAVLDFDLAFRRQYLLALRRLSDRNQHIFDGVMNYFTRPADDHKRVISVLLGKSANANRRYKVEAHHIAEWTPTLFAAQIGDVEVFKMLVSNGGDPDLTLMRTSSLERLDALWVAVRYERHAIVSFLTGRQRHS